MDDAARSLLALGLAGLLLPLWLLAGFADAMCHRHMRIERTTGLAESLMHLAMLAELGVALLAAMFLELTAGALLLMLLACAAHEVTVWVDLRYAEARRGIPWFEQWLHGLQQALPWVGLAGLVVLSPGQALAIVGLGAERAAWVLRLKTQPLPGWYVAAVFAAGLVMIALPFGAETLRAWRRPAGARVVARPGAARTR